MTSHRYGLALRGVGRILAGGATASQGSGRLLERFVADRDESAFEALVHQHGPMVLGTCRRMLVDPHDVDDAFQATFLVLARRAGSIRDAERLGPWLHGVARRVATRSRALSARRNSRERPGAEEPSAEPPDSFEDLELRSALDDELARLPEKYRDPLILCYLEGLTHDEAALRLRWPVGTVRSRLAGGRDRLRDRLTRRGLAPSIALPAAWPGASIPDPLLTATVKVATSAGLVPAHLAALAKGALIAMMGTKLKLVAVLGLTAGLTVGGAGVAGQLVGKGEGVAANQVPTADPPVNKDSDERERIEKQIAAARVRLEALEPVQEAIEKAWKVIGSRKDVDHVLPKDSGSNGIAVLSQQTTQIDAEIDATRRIIEGWQSRLAALLDPDRTGKQVEKPANDRGTTPKPDDDLARLQGTWKVTGVKPFPNGLTDESLADLMIRGKTVILTKRGEEVGRKELTLGQQGGLKTLDFLTINKDDTRSTGACLYRFDGERLEICSGPPNGPRPTDFKAGDLGSFPVILWFERDSGELRVGDLRARIQQLEKQVADQQAMLRRQQDRSTQSNNPPIPPQPESTKDDRPRMEGLPKAPSEATKLEPAPAKTGIDFATESPTNPEEGKPPVAAPPDPQPIVHTLRGDHPRFAVISAGRDRVTMIDSATKERASFRMPKGATEIIPIVGPGIIISLDIKGPEITRTAFYNQGDKRWHEYDLKEPATEVRLTGGPAMFAFGLSIRGTIITRIAAFDFADQRWTTYDLREPAREGLDSFVDRFTVTYRVGRFVYKYSTIAKNWSVLELKRESAVSTQAGLSPPTPDGMVVIPDGDIIHVYDPKVGDWTHIDTNDEK